MSALRSECCHGALLIEPLQKREASPSTSLMDLDYAVIGNVSGREQETSGDQNDHSRYQRLTADQMQHLEAFFKQCPYPDEPQRRQLGTDLGLEPTQIKFWFQNRRARSMAQRERADINVLKMENEKLKCENLELEEALKILKCPTCEGPFLAKEEQLANLHKVKIEHEQLQQEHDRLSQLLANILGKPVAPAQPPSHSVDFQIGYPGHERSGGPSFEFGVGNSRNSTMLHKSAMLEMANRAMAELTMLLQGDEPFWVKSLIDGRYVLHSNSYSKVFPRLDQFKSFTPQIESSKVSGLVAMSAKLLLDMFLDSNKWVDLFPTIVTKARTIEVLDTRMLGDDAGTLQLMHEKMHILSPLVASREFYFLRYCREIKPSMWVIVDASYDYSRVGTGGLPLRSWRLPSGCMIEDKLNGWSEVTWVEHVKVDDSQTHDLYRDLLCGVGGYGAERWIFTLQRMSERLQCFAGARFNHKHGVVDMPDRRRSIMNLSHRMVKKFLAMLSLSSELKYPILSKPNNGVWISIRQNNEPGQASGIIVGASLSAWFPLSCEALFNFLRDEKARAQWDVLACGNPGRELAHISCGTHPGNRISIIQSLAPTTHGMLMLQESCSDPSGSIIVYAPVEASAFQAISCQNSNMISIMPSGFIISGDGRSGQGSVSEASTSTSNKSVCCGSLLTVATQILVCTPLPPEQLTMDSLDMANTLICYIVEKIRAALGCSSVLRPREVSFFV